MTFSGSFQTPPGAGVATGNTGKFVTVTTATYTVTNENIIYVDPVALGFNVTITLPLNNSFISTTTNQTVTIKNQSTLNTFTAMIDTTASETIDGALTLELKKLESVELSPDGSKWSII